MVWSPILSTSDVKPKTESGFQPILSSAQIKSTQDKIDWSAISVKPSDPKNIALNTYPFTPEAQNIIKKSVDISMKPIQDNIGGQTLLPDYNTGSGQRPYIDVFKKPLQQEKTSIELNSKIPGLTNDPLPVAHEIFHALFARSVFSPKDFNSAWEQVASSNPILQGMDKELFQDPNAASVYRTGAENVNQDPYQLATERYALLGKYLGADGISSIPSDLQKYYKPFLTDFGKKQQPFTQNAIADNQTQAKNLIASAFPAVPDVIHAVQTGDWQPYFDKIKQNGINIQNLSNPDPSIHGPEMRKLGAMVLSVGGEAENIAQQADRFASFAAKSSDSEQIAQQAKSLLGVSDTQAAKLGKQLSNVSDVQAVKDAITPIVQKMSTIGNAVPKVQSGPLGDTVELPQEPKAGAPQTGTEVQTPLPQDSARVSSLAKDTSVLKTNPTLNVERLNISQDAKDIVTRTIEDIRPKIEAQIGRPLTNESILELADNSSQTLSKVVGEESTAAWESTMLKARQEIALAASTGTVDQHFIDTILAIKTQGTDIARKLQSMKIGADPKETSAAQTIISAVLDQTNNIDEVVKAAEGVDFNNAQEAAKFYRQFVKPKASEWLDLLRYNSMLSSPKTHIVNIVSNALNSAVVAPVEYALSGGLDFLSSSVTGNERKYFAGESGVYLKDYFSNIREGFKNFVDVMNGVNANSNLDTRNIPLAPEGGIKGAAETALSFPLKMLEGMDQLFTTPTNAGEAGRLAYRAGKGVAVTPTEMATKPGVDAAYRLYRSDLFPEGQGTILNAIDEVTSLLYRMRTSKNPIISYPAKFSVPFIKTPMNVFKQGIEYSPAGYLTMIGAGEKNPQLAKAIMGSAVAAIGGLLLASNRMTWANPVNEQEKNAFLAAGMQPYSIKLGDTWVSYQKLPPPLSFPLSMIALVNQAIKEKTLNESTGEMILSAVSKYGQFLADQSYAKSFGDLLAAVQGGESSIAKLAGDYPAQLVPFRALGGWLARLVDHVQRKPDPDGTFIEKEVQLLMMNIPGLSQKVLARTDASGQPIEAPDPILNAFSPFAVSPENKKNIKDYQAISDIRQISKDQAAGRTILTDQASKEYARLSNLSKEEAAAQFDKLAKDNPALAQKVADLVVTDQKGLTGADKALLSLGVVNSERAKYIAKQISALKTKEEKAALWEEYTKKKIINSTVAGQLKTLLK